MGITRDEGGTKFSDSSRASRGLVSYTCCTTPCFHLPPPHPWQPPLVAAGSVRSVERFAGHTVGSLGILPSTKNTLALGKSAIIAIDFTTQRLMVVHDSSSIPPASDPFPGKPCNQSGDFLPPGTPPTPLPPKSSDDWTPFTSRAGFELAEILYMTASLSNSIIDNLLSIWNATLAPHNDAAPFTDHEDLHATVDAIKLGDVPWQSYTIRYNGLYPEDGPTPEWMTTDFQLWYRNPRKVIRNILANPALVDSIDYVPYREFENGKRRYRDFMSGNWAWKQCVRTYHC